VGNQGEKKDVERQQHILGRDRQLGKNGQGKKRKRREKNGVMGEPKQINIEFGKSG